MKETLAQVEDAKKLELLTGKGEKKINKHAAEDDDYLEKLFDKFSSKDKKGNVVVTKANAYKAA